MKLAELEPKFITVEPGDVGLRFRSVETFGEAQGVEFKCPCCLGTEWEGLNKVRIFFVSNLANYQVWSVAGTSLDDLTLSPSILLSGGCNWHGWVRAGEVVVA